MDPDAPHQNLLQLGPHTVSPVERCELGNKLFLLALGEHILALELFRNRPAFVPAETEEQGRGAARLGIAAGHFFEMLVEQPITDPLERQRDFAVGALGEFQPPRIAISKPREKLDGITDRRRQQEQPHMSRQQGEREFPDDASFHVSETVKLIHHDCGYVLKRERLGLQQAIQQYLGYDDEDLGFRINAPVSRDQADIFGTKSPAYSGRLYFQEFLIG